MEIIEKRVKDLIPYAKNPRKNDDAVEYVKNSILSFGFKIPIIIDASGVIVAGHTRLKAAKEIGMETVPCIVADDLTPEQIKAFRLADNKVAEKAEWDFDLLDEEIADLSDLFDFSDFGFDFFKPDEDDEEEKENARERTNEAYNLGLIDTDALTKDFWQMPIIENNHHIPKDLVGFNYAKSYDDHSVGIHFYIDDYQFERVWNSPYDYLDVLQEYDCILSPDFSLYMDMPMSMKIWNVYRSRLIGQYYQRRGLWVIPTISWAEEETFEFCFKGIPKESIVSVSTVGVRKAEESIKIFKSGMDEMIRQIEPSVILLYGGEVEYDYRGIEVHRYENKVTERMKQY